MNPAGPKAERRSQRHPSAAILLLLPYAALCFPMLYARAKPALFGFPFFYWYQLLWVVLTSGLLWLYYRLYSRQD